MEDTIRPREIEHQPARSPHGDRVGRVFRAMQTEVAGLKTQLESLRRVQDTAQSKKKKKR